MWEGRGGLQRGTEVTRRALLLMLARRRPRVASDGQNALPSIKTLKKQKIMKLQSTTGGRSGGATGRAIPITLIEKSGKIDFNYMIFNM